MLLFVVSEIMFFLLFWLLLQPQIAHMVSLFILLLDLMC
jgi:hypothetical protein